MKIVASFRPEAAEPAGPGLPPPLLQHGLRASELLQLERLDHFAGRVRGLLGRAPLGPGEGVWLEPCRAVHTVGMRYAIDVVFLDRDARVLRVLASMAPGRAALIMEAHSVVELAAGESERLAIAPGSRLLTYGEVPRRGAEAFRQPAW